MVEIKNLNLSYPSGENVLKNISLKIKEGECILLTGESGSGKSSIINSINGLAIRYNGCSYIGEIKVKGKDTKDMELYEISMMVSSVFQNPKTHFFNVNTTLELLFSLENMGVSREEMDRRMEEMLNIFPIEHLLNRDIFKLSGGEKQILCIASTYISGARLIVLDEPSSNLDDKYTSLMAEMLKKLKEKGITLIIAEHRIYYLMDIVDRVFFIKDGEIAKEYKKDEFLKVDKHELIEKGLRSRSYEALRIKENLKDGDFCIKKIFYTFPSSNRGIKVNELGLKKGFIYGIIGKNGIGKSTFIKSLIGVNKAVKDEIIFENEKLSKGKRLKMSSFVMQDVNHQLFTDSVEHEASFGIKDIDEKRVEEVLQRLGLIEFKDRHPMSLSGGQKQRVAIASVLLSNSKIICFDEPTSGMDYKNMVEISKLIKNTIDNEKIILIISHDTEFLNMTADSIINMEKCEFGLR